MFEKWVKSVIFAMVLGNCPAGFANAAAIQAKSCKQIDVQAAIDLAQDGDTVSVPQCNDTTWVTPSGSAWMTPAVKIKNKRITLQGQGIGETVINNGNDGAYPTLLLEGDSIRVTGISLSNIPGYQAPKGIIHVRYSTNWRIDHCEIREGFGKSNAIYINASNGGVLDHCIYRQGPGDTKIFSIDDANSSKDIITQNPLLVRNGYGAWQRPLGLGTSDAVFIEDCTFLGVDKYPALDIDWGSRCVFRYNIVSHTSIGGHGGEHPDTVYSSSKYGERGMLSYEVYHSTFIGNGNAGTGIAFRGGTGVVFMNLSKDHENSFISLACYCGCSHGAWGGGNACKPGPYLSF